MTSREEIEVANKQLLTREDLMLEVLLDIRDLLQNPPVEVLEEKKPSLKETLLLELKRLPPLGEVTVIRLAEDGNAVSHLVSFKAVEDIINRLMP